MPSPHTAKKPNEERHLTKEFDKAAEVAIFYGFSLIKTPRFEKTDREKVSSLIKNIPVYDLPELFPRMEERAATFRTCTEQGLLEKTYPLMVYYKRPIVNFSLRRYQNEHHSTLEIYGSASGMCEAIAIQTAISILKEYGFDNVSVHINTVGDRESISRFERELQNFHKKTSGTLPDDLKVIFKKNPYEMLRNEHDAWKEHRDLAPKSMNFLSQQSIEHFKEVLEHLESLSIPYNVDHRLVMHGGLSSHTIFEIKHELDGKNITLAYGSRNNHITKKLGYKKDIPILSVNIGFRKPQSQPKLFFKKIPAPKFYFIQFGLQAKLRSLSVIEDLRQARIPVHHSLTKDKLVGQISNAETSSVPYVIIMGQKEAFDGTVVVRHVASRVQQTVRIPELPTYLSRLKLTK